MAERSLIPGTFNARDLGGLRAGDTRVRAGVLIRSDAPVDLGHPGRRVLVDRNVHTMIDLREPSERALAPADVAGLSITVVTQPLLGGQPTHGALDLAAIYTRPLDERGGAFVSALAALADALDHPVVIFCSAGKDRTGLLTAMVLSLLGVEREEIVADYHRTEANMRGGLPERITRAALASGLSEQQLAAGLGAPVALMGAVLDRLDAAGGAAAYLTRHGLPAEVPERLAVALLEP